MNFHISFRQNPDNKALSLYVSKRLTLTDTAIESPNAIPKLRAYLVVTVSLDYLSDLLLANRIGESGISFVTDKVGNVLFHTDSINFEQFADQQSKDVHRHGYIPKQKFSQLKQAIQKNSVLKTDLFDEKAYLRGVPIGDHLYLFAWLPAEELLAKTEWIKVIVLIITGIAIFLTVTLIFSALKYFVIDPVKILDKAAYEIGHGNLEFEFVLDRNDEVGSLASSLKDMNDNLKKSSEQIKFIAYHDALTGLPNRLMFRDYLSHAIAVARRKKETLALLFLDLDNFKWVNDTMGHDAGDSLLIEISNRLTATLRDSDFIAKTSIDDAEDVLARLGGDEFIIMLSNCSDNISPYKVASRIIKNVQQPIHIAEHEVYIGVSIGITVYPDDAEDTDTLIKNADIAMYHAKSLGKNNYQYFSDSMNDVAERRLKMESRVRYAIEQKQFSLHYQPQVEVTSGNIIGVEALIRWQHPERGFIPPDEFIPVAEETGQIVSIGEWVLNEACQQIRNWRKAGLPELTVAVNVSSIQFIKQDFAQVIESIIKQNNMPPQLLEIELTESIFIDNPQHASDMLATIRAMGIEVSLDDFGTGYSSLGYLRQFPIDNLKIDRCFINEIGHSLEGEAVITAIISMAHAMNLKVIAEGVEDSAQLAFLRAQKCDYIQGYYFYRPMPASEIVDILSNQQSGRTSSN